MSIQVEEIIHGGVNTGGDVDIGGGVNTGGRDNTGGGVNTGMGL